MMAKLNFSKVLNFILDQYDESYVGEGATLNEVWSPRLWDDYNEIEDRIYATQLDEDQKNLYGIINFASYQSITSYMRSVFKASGSREIEVSSIPQEEYLRYFKSNMDDEINSKLWEFIQI